MAGVVLLSLVVAFASFRGVSVVGICWFVVSWRLCVPVSFGVCVSSRSSCVAVSGF